ncbi:MAG: LysR family transcriptional regulator [Clostridia bacterium]|nr:LysR family transcriptional regulator [Clostridia bacterium]
MEIRCLKTFLQVAERSSFTKAAEALNYTQSTVSSQIKQLETELNTQLFDRFHHSVTLTDTGRALLERAHKILNLVDEVQAASSDPAASREPVRFAMAPSVCSIMMGATYLTFYRTFPDVPVKILEAESDRMLEMLNQNDVDLIFRVDRREVNSEHVVAFEKKEAAHFVVARDSKLCRREHIRPEELSQYPLFLSEKGLSYRRLLDEALAERNLTVAPIVEMGNTQLLLELVELGGGISFLPEYVTRNSHREGKIRYIEAEDLSVEVWCQLIYHKNKWVSPSMKKVIDYCSAVAETLL